MVTPYLRLGGCREEPGGRYIAGLQSIARAEFFTVYLMDREGMAHALVDRDTLMGGVRVMCEIAYKSGLGATLCPFLSATE